MGEAKRRGDFTTRRAEAIAAGRVPEKKREVTIHSGPSLGRYLIDTFFSRRPVKKVKPKTMEQEVKDAADGKVID